MDELVRSLAFAIARLNDAVALAPLVITGTDEPEGNVPAYPNTFYVHSDAASGQSLFFKERGLGAQGWIKLTAVSMGAQVTTPAAGGLSVTGLAPTVVVA